MNNVILGGDMMLFVKGKSIAMATNHTLSISAETKETSSKDSGGKWQTSEVGILSWTVSSENIYSAGEDGTGYDELFDLMVKREKITGVFSLKKEDQDSVPEGGWTAKGGEGYTGEVIITSLELNAPNGENATFTCEFTGVGELKKVTA